jgi:ribosomal protein S18 acetylase RimI-like enzyme
MSNMDSLVSSGECAVRSAHVDDLDRLSVIDAACFPQGIAYPREYLRRLLCSPTSVTRVASIAAVIVGFAIIEVRARGLKVVGELVTIDVLAEVRHQGVGRLLHASVERAVRHRGGHKIRLQVSVENTAAIQFYEQLGYRTRGRIPRYYLNTIDAWWMEKCWKEPKNL